MVLVVVLARRWSDDRHLQLHRLRNVKVLPDAALDETEAESEVPDRSLDRAFVLWRNVRVLDEIRELRILYLRAQLPPQDRRHVFLRRPQAFRLRFRLPDGYMIQLDFTSIFYFKN